MLSDLEKTWLLQQIKEAVKEALTVEMQVEKAIDDNTGQPLPHKEYRVEQVFLPAYFCQHLKFHEGAYRGMQETVDKVTNVSNRTADDVKLICQTLITMTDPLLGAAHIIEHLRDVGLLDMIEQENTKQIAYNEESKLGKLKRIIEDDGASEAEKNKAKKAWQEITGEEYRV